MISPKELLLRAMHWRKLAPGQWSASVNDQHCALRMNDFPEEPLYTVSVNGMSVDIDDAPHIWTIE